jgi:hypothetical protein
MRDRKIQVGALAALIAMSAISVTSTILGAKQFAAESNSSTALVSVNDSLRAGYADEWNVPITLQRRGIQTIEDNANEKIAKKQLYSMLDSDKELIASKQATITQLITERDAALVTWDARNEKVLSSVQGKDTELVRFFVIFSALVEIMAVGCVWFVMYYEFRVIVESGKLAKIRRGARIGETDEHGNSRKVLVPTNGSSAGLPVNGKSIGFGNKTDENGNPTAEYTVQRMCDNCNSTFEPKRYDHRFCGSKCRGNFHAKFRVR